MSIQQTEQQLQQDFGEQITISVERNWVWIGGETYPIKNQLKEKYNARFSSKRKEWYIVCSTSKIIPKKAAKQTSVKIPKGTNKVTKKKNGKPLLRYRLSWGTSRGTTKLYKYEEVEIEAVSFTRAKVLATQTVKKWAEPHEFDDEQMAARRTYIRTSLHMGNNSDRWRGEVKSKKDGKPFITKKLGGMWSQGEYIALKLISDIA